MHPLCRPIPADRNGPFVAMPDGRLMTVDAQGLRTSKDEGKTWSAPQPVCKGINPKEPASFYVLCAGSGALVASAFFLRKQCVRRADSAVWPACIH